MITYVFPGQGSQQKGMGKELFDVYQEYTAKADEVLGYSIKELCLEDPNLQLSQTQYTQPALFVVNTLCYLDNIAVSNKPDYVAGHSLGEYNALFAAGAFDFETGLKLVKKRGELMSQATGGGMAAVVGLTEEEVEDVLNQNNLKTIDLANYNTPFQIVISGPKLDIEQAKPFFEQHKNIKMFAPLKTSGAFHSRYMENAQKEFERFVDSFTFSALTIPAISNAYARPYQHSDIKKNLMNQITHPVKWTESIRYLMGLGEMEFKEIGTGKVLTGLIQRIKKEAEPLKIADSEVNVANKKNSITVTDAIKNMLEKAKSLVSINEEITKPEKQDEQFPVKKEVNIDESHNYEKEFPKNKKDNAETEGVQHKQIISGITAESLGDQEFKKDYQLKYAYVSGAMYRGVASKEMVVKMGMAGMMGFLGTGGLEMAQIEDSIQYIQKELSNGQAYGMNLLSNPHNPDFEEKTVDLYLKHNVRNVEAAAFLSITPALVKFRAKGLKLDQNGEVITSNRIIGKISRPEVAESFLSPAPERMVTKLLIENKITQKEADLLKKVPMADDLIAEADSGGHTDGGVAYALIPTVIRLRDQMLEKYKFTKRIRIGAAGGIGTPEAAAAAFMLGADFIVTGSINQCTVEACTSDVVKDLLQQINVQDTEYAPAGDMFEFGAKVQVLKKGVFFAARANKLYELYRHHNSLNEIDHKTKAQIEEKYFKRSFEEVYEDVKNYYPAQEIEKAERNPKHKMALIFRWYFGYSSRLALSGDDESKVDYQVHCGPALGAFNQWVKGTDLEDWHNRHVDEIGIKMMEYAAELINQRWRTIV
jgi:trans-AT polyketide synthase, acyltransferase and oxidoreductase domains